MMKNRKVELNFTPWEVVDSNDLLIVDPWIKVWREKVQLPSGKIISDFHRVSMPNASGIVPVSPEGDVMLLRQYKHGVGRMVLTLPGGFCAKNEVPLDCAQRELMEETGYSGTEWIDLGSYVRDGNRGGGIDHLFLAMNVSKVSEPDHLDFEATQVEWFSISDVLDLIRLRKIDLVGAAAALLLAKLYLDDN